MKHSNNNVNPRGCKNTYTNRHWHYQRYSYIYPKTWSDMFNLFWVLVSGCCPAEAVGPSWTPPKHTNTHGAHNSGPLAEVSVGIDEQSGFGVHRLVTWWINCQEGWFHHAGVHSKSNTVSLQYHHNANWQSPFRNCVPEDSYLHQWK